MKFCAQAGGKSCNTAFTCQQRGAYAACGGRWEKDTSKETAQVKAVSGSTWARP
jgi:hypothetical protein